jgi:RNA polymerase sigma-70 factor (ECF subfamily)
MRRTQVTITVERVEANGKDAMMRSRAMALKAPSEAFEAAFQDHWSKVCAVLYRLTGDPDEAEDLALETFWRLYVKPPKDERNLGGWLYRVAVNLGYNALRSQKRRARYEAQAFLPHELTTEKNPAVEQERLEERRLVRKTLSQMSRRAVQLLVLRNTGLTYAEIAVAIGVSASSIGTLLSRAERDFERRFRALEGS